MCGFKHTQKHTFLQPCSSTQKRRRRAEKFRFFFSFFLSCRVTATGRYWKFISHMYSLISQLWRGSAGQMLSAVSSHGRQTEQKDCASLGRNSGGVGWRRLMMFDPVCVCEWTPGASTEQHQTDAGATVTLASTPKFNRTRGSSSRFTDTLHWGQEIWKQDQIRTKRKEKKNGISYFTTKKTWL